MREQGGGAVVNVASVTGKEGNPGQVPYSVSKAGVIALTKALSREVAPLIRVNCVAPALIDTRMLDDLPSEVLEYAQRANPAWADRGSRRRSRRWCTFSRPTTPSFVTGQCYDVSGGRSTY